MAQKIIVSQVTNEKYLRVVNYPNVLNKPPSRLKQSFLEITLVDFKKKLV